MKLKRQDFKAAEKCDREIQKGPKVARRSSFTVALSNFRFKQG